MSRLHYYTATMGAEAEAEAGSASWSLARVAVAGVGTVSADGMGSWTLGRVTADGMGSVTSPGTGSGAWTLRRVAVAGSGGVTIPGSGDWPIRRVTVAGAGSVLASGTGGWILHRMAVAGSGTVVAPGTGSGAWTLRRVTVQGSGGVTASGSGIWTLRPVIFRGGFVEAPTEVFLAALRTRMLAALDLDPPSDSTLSRSRAGAAFPNLIITTLFAEPFIDSSETWYEEVHCQFDLFSQDADLVNELGRAAYRSLKPRAANPPLVFTDGYEMTRLPGRWRGPEAEPGGMVGGDTVWRFSFDYIFMIGRD